MKVGIRRLLWTVWDALSWMRNEGRGWPLIKNVNFSWGLSLVIMSFSLDAGVQLPVCQE